MPYNPDIHKRRSIRIKDYDYSKSGLYFITICTKDRECIFGMIIDETMDLNNYGKIVEAEILETCKIRKEIAIQEYIIMPNHIHLIIEVIDVGAYGIRPTTKNIRNATEQGVSHTPLQSPSKTIGSAIRGIKSAVSRNIGYSVWQRNYHEHIIRNENSLYKIIEYIRCNPLNWKEDCNYKD